MSKPPSWERETMRIPCSATIGVVAAFATVMFFSPMPSAASEQEPMSMAAEGCISGQSLRAHFDELYVNDNPRFWSVVRCHGQRAKSCSSRASVATFLSLSAIGEGNAEFGEYFSETVENLLLENPQCLFTELERSNALSRKSVITRLKAPLFVDEERVAMIFREVTKTPSFPKVAREYLEY